MPTVESPIKVGDPIPSFTLKDQDGTARTLPTGKPSVLVFFRGQWCPYCRWELTGLQTINRAVTELGAELLGVSPDSEVESQDLRQKLSLAFSILSDGDLTVTDRFGLRHVGGRAATGEDKPRFLRPSLSTGTALSERRSKTTPTVIGRPRRTCSPRSKR